MSNRPLDEDLTVVELSDLINALGLFNTPEWEPVIKKLKAQLEKRLRVEKETK